VPGPVAVRGPRLFIALPVPVGVAEEIETRTAAIRGSAGAALRWMPPDLLHLTLRFLGTVPLDRVGPIADAVGRVAAAGAPLEVRAGPAPRLGRGAPHVLAIGIAAADDGLERLRASLDGALAEVGIEPDPSPLRAHLTLARPRGRSGVVDPGRVAPVTQALAAVRWRADALVLFESELTPTGARHRPVRVAPLAAEPGSSDGDGRIAEAPGQRPTAPSKGTASTCRSPSERASSPPSDSST
jgi:2'-5' RNA ligase